MKRDTLLQTNQSFITHFYFWLFIFLSHRLEVCNHNLAGLLPYFAQTNSFFFQFKVCNTFVSYDFIEKKMPGRGLFSFPTKKTVCITTVKINKIEKLTDEAIILEVVPEAVFSIPT